MRQRARSNTRPASAGSDGYKRQGRPLVKQVGGGLASAFAALVFAGLWLHVASLAVFNGVFLRRLHDCSADTYQELLWHLLLRGHETFFMWCPSDQIVQETQLVHQVYAASLEYRDFLDSGTPIIFDLSPQPGPVVSAIRLGNRLLVGRTDFNSQGQSLSLTADGKAFQVPPPGEQCLIIDLD